MRNTRTITRLFYKQTGWCLLALFITISKVNAMSNVSSTRAEVAQQYAIACDLHNVACSLDKAAVAYEIKSLICQFRWATAAQIFLKGVVSGGFFNGTADYDPLLFPFMIMQKPMPGTLTVLKKYTGNDYPQGTLFRFSNMSDPAYEAICEKYPEMKIFSAGHGIVTAEIREKKPHPRAYQRFLALLQASHPQIPIENILFIDDRKKNILAAQKAGIEARLFTTAAQLDQDISAWLKKKSLKLCS